MKRSYQVKLDRDRISALAAQAVDDHQELLDEGYSLMGSSAVWRTDRGGFTVRRVYRLRRPDRVRTVTHIMRDVRPQ